MTEQAATVEGNGLKREELAAAIQKERQTRVNAANTEITEICQKYGVALLPVMTITGNRVQSEVQLVIATVD